MNTVHINLALTTPETKRRQTVESESDTQTTYAPSNDFLTPTQIVCPTQGAHIQCLIFRETNEQTNGTDNQTELVLVNPYNAIRSGIPGHVRSKNELSNNDLSFITDKQLLIYKQKDIQKIINSFEGREDLALMVLRRMTQFGNIKSLEHLNNKLTEMLGENYVVYTDKGPALATNLMYLFRKSAFTQEPQVIHLKNLDHIFSPDKNPDQTSRKPALLVDEYILERLKSNPQLVQKLQNSGVMLIIPESFDTGVSFCNQAINIKKRLTRLVNKVEQIQTKTDLGLDDCIDRVLNGKTGTAMQAFKDQLNDQQLADVITYERNAWGNNTGVVVSAAQVKAARQQPAATQAVPTTSVPATNPATNNVTTTTQAGGN